MNDPLTQAVKGWEKKLRAMQEPYQANAMQFVEAVIKEAERVFQANTQGQDDGSQDR